MMPEQPKQQATDEGGSWSSIDGLAAVVNAASPIPCCSCAHPESEFLMCCPMKSGRASVHLPPKQADAQQA